MQKITSIIELRESIALLEIKQSVEGELLKEQFKETYESIKPINLIKNTLKELTSAPDLKGDLLNASLSLAAGYLSKKVAIGSTDNPFKQILGTLLQMGVTSIVAKNADGIKSSTMNILNKLFTKKTPTEEYE
jgi:hypothetical protein